MPDGPLVIPARRGQAAFVAEGQTTTVININTRQVVDTRAFGHANVSQFMSMAHSRAGMQRLIATVGDALPTNHRRPIVTLREDTSGGVHDARIAACDVFRYQGLGCAGYHDNRTDNLAQAMHDLGLAPPETPSPLNCFMNIPSAADGTLSYEPPVSTSGGYVVLPAEMDLVIAFSACPQDVLPLNGAGRRPTKAHFVIA